MLSVDATDPYRPMLRAHTNLGTVSKSEPF
jgi:hypothetical protein